MLDERLDEPVPGVDARLGGDGPASRAAVAEVTGLRLARRIVAADPARASSGRRAWSRSVIAELVRVIQSTEPAAIRSRTAAGRASASALR